MLLLCLAIALIPLALAASAPPVASTWFAGWHAVDADPIFGVSDLSWEKYTSVAYAFATSTDDDAHIGLADSDKQILPDFVKTAKANNVKAILSYGGWGGSQFFSWAMSPANRTATVNSILKLVAEYKLDGIDFDWEYPGNQGIGCNVVQGADTADFLATIQQLRSTSVGKNLILTAAVATPFVDANGVQMTDLSGFAEALDWIEIMNYDIYGNWSTALGPNSPLNSTCITDPDSPGLSAVTTVQTYISTGFPASKIVLGVASYGHTFFVPSSNVPNAQALTQYPAFDAGKTQGPEFGDTWNNASGVDMCGNFAAAGGTMDYWGLGTQGFLNLQSGTPESGIEHAFDTCTQTDYVYNTNTQIAVNYDSPQAFSAKGSFIAQSGLRGFAMWEAGGDYQDQLLDAIRSSAGFSKGAAASGGTAVS